MRGHCSWTRGLLNHSHLQEAVITLETFLEHPMGVSWELTEISVLGPIIAVALIVVIALAEIHGEPSVNRFGCDKNFFFI